MFTANTTYYMQLNAHLDQQETRVWRYAHDNYTGFFYTRLTQVVLVFVS